VVVSFVVYKRSYSTLSPVSTGMGDRLLSEIECDEHVMKFAFVLCWSGYADELVFIRLQRGRAENSASASALRLPRPVVQRTVRRRHAGRAHRSRPVGDAACRHLPGTQKSRLDQLAGCAQRFAAFRRHRARSAGKVRHVFSATCSRPITARHALL